jgi:hypothetical protein
LRLAPRLTVLKEGQNHPQLVSHTAPLNTS